MDAQKDTVSGNISANSVAPSDAARVAAIATQLNMVIPPECAAGVAQNSALLDQHWAALRAPRTGQ